MNADGMRMNARSIGRRSGTRCVQCPVHTALRSLARRACCQVTHPMDLTTLEGKYLAGSYTSILQLADDLSLIWANAMAYNPADTCARAAPRTNARDAPVPGALSAQCTAEATGPRATHTQVGPRRRAQDAGVWRPQAGAAPRGGEGAPSSGRRRRRRRRAARRRGGRAGCQRLTPRGGERGAGRVRRCEGRRAARRPPATEGMGRRCVCAARESSGETRRVDSVDGGRPSRAWRRDGGAGRRTRANGVPGSRGGWSVAHSCFAGGASSRTRSVARGKAPGVC